MAGGVGGKMDAPKCCKLIYGTGTFNSPSCSRSGVIQRNGKLWCKQHDPEKVAARRAAQSAKWEAEHEAQNQVRRAAVDLAAELGVGLPEYSTYSGKGRYTGGITLSAEEARRVIGWLVTLRKM